MGQGREAGGDGGVAGALGFDSLGEDAEEGVVHLRQVEADEVLQVPLARGTEECFDELDGFVFGHGLSTLHWILSVGSDA